MLINSQPQFYPISIPPLNGDFLTKITINPPVFPLGELTGGTPQRDSELISGYCSKFLGGVRICQIVRFLNTGRGNLVY